MAGKTERVQTRIHVGKKLFCRRAAEKMGMSLSEFLEVSGVDRAEAVLGAKFLDWWLEQPEFDEE